jgi:hypothetical protein
VALCALVLLVARGPEARDERLPGWFDLDVPGGESTLTNLGLSLEERAFTLPTLARVLYDRDQRVVSSELLRVIADVAIRAQQGNGKSDTVNIPAPLDEDAWREILPPVAPRANPQLFFRIVSDRNALLVASGLVSTSDSIRELLMRDRGLLRAIYQEGAGPFAIVARRLEIHDGRVLIPGGESAAIGWQTLAGTSPTRPGQFIRALVTKDQGRLAWYYDTMGGLNAEQFQAAWPDTVAPSQRGAALYQAFRDSDPQWRAYEQPFRRGAIDAWAVATLNHAAGGVLVSPLPQSTWETLFANSRPSRSQIARSLNEASAVSLPWLAGQTLSPIVRERRIRHEMFRLAQRVFAEAQPDQGVDIALALSGLRQRRALVLTLERMAIRHPSIWAAVVEAAGHVSERSDDRRASIISFQATLAMLERMRHVRTLDLVAAEGLLLSLSDTVRMNDKVSASLAKWITETLMPALPPLVQPDGFTGQTAYESTVLQALAGPADRVVPSVTWEGLTYAADPIGAEHDRLQAMRTLLPSPGLDAALAAQSPQQLANALVALVYATALGDPEGAASLSPDVASRHDFGFNATALLRDELPWSPPEERQGHGPWHVQGSLLGLDLAMSRLFLRRVADQQMPQAPTLTLNDLGTLTRTGVALVASELPDADRDELAAAIARGRARLQAAQTTDAWQTLAIECGMSHAARQLIPWLASRQRETVPALFSLRDLMWLGKPALATAALDRWGVSGDGLDGRRVLAMPGPSPWDDYAGRSEIGQVTTQVPDVTLALVEATARMKLPAQLIPSLLAFALGDFWHEVRVRFADDWPRMARHASTLSPLRIQDYVAALAGGGPLRPQ